MNLAKSRLNIKKVKITFVVLDKNGKPVRKQVISKEDGIISSEEENMNGSN